MSNPKPHPYYYSPKKNVAQRFVDFALPTALFLLYFIFYNFGKITHHGMIKNTGLLAISLLVLTLLIGPLTRVFPRLEFLKAHRKFWGILSFLVALLHVILVYIYHYKFNFLRLINFTDPQHPEILFGILALVILFLVTLTSNQKAVTIFSPKTWKLIQTTSYLALILAVSHFYLMKIKNGILVMEQTLEQITFWFALLVILARVVILFLPSKK